MTSSIKMASTQANRPKRPHPPSTLNNRGAENRQGSRQRSRSTAPEEAGIVVPRSSLLLLGCCYFTQDPSSCPIEQWFSITRTVKYNWVSRKYQQNWWVYTVQSADIDDMMRKDSLSINRIRLLTHHHTTSHQNHVITILFITMPLHL